MSNIKKIKVAILGSGNIGTDLLVKVMRSQYLECSMFIGRRFDSPGMNKAQALGVKLFNNSIQAIVDNPGSCDLIFDATTARDHLRHWPIIEKLGKIVIDMTPSKIGKMIVPAVNLNSLNGNKNVNMVSCGGQSAIPLACVLTKALDDIEYIEIVSSIASLSAGPGTRVNIDEYVENTEDGIRNFSGCKKVKVILVLNPAQPCIDMQTTISAKVKDPNMEKVKKAIGDMEKNLQRYVPGYKIVVPPVYEDNRILIMVRVKGLGDYLPSYAGNLDIINCAAIATAEDYAKNQNLWRKT